MTDPVPDPTPDPKPDPNPTPAPSASFTQADVDRIVKDRLAREALKYEGHEDLKAKAAELDRIHEGEKTALQKAEERAALLEQQAAEALAKSAESTLRAAVVSEAATRKVVDPEAAVILLDRSTLEFDDNGAPTNLAQAMDSLLEAKPYLVAKPGASGLADQGARGGTQQLSREDLKSMTAEQIVEAQKAGQLDAALGVAK